MEINIITPSSRLTGGIRVLAELTNGLAARGHRMRWVTLGDPKELNWIDLNAEIIHVARTLPEKVAGIFYRTAFGFQPFPEEETRKVIKALPKSDFNIAGMSYLGFAVHRAPFGVPLQYFMHYEPLVRGEGYKRRVIEESYHLPIGQIANSTWVANQIKEQAGRDVVGLVLPAIDHDVFHTGKRRARDKTIHLCTLAKDKEWKAFPDVLRAVRILRERGHRVELSAFGTTFSMSKLPDDVRDIPFTFTGPKANQELAQLYRDSDILVSASYFESFPLPQLEAMACGTPVVTTPYGTEDYAHDGENALIVPPKSPESIANAIVKLVESEEPYKNLVQNGLRTAAKFTWGSSVDQLVSILKRHSQS